MAMVYLLFGFDYSLAEETGGLLLKSYMLVRRVNEHLASVGSKSNCWVFPINYIINFIRLCSFAVIGTAVLIRDDSDAGVIDKLR